MHEEAPTGEQKGSSDRGHSGPRPEFAEIDKIKGREKCQKGYQIGGKSRTERMAGPPDWRAHNH
jgi:hypothetical protein